MRVSHVNFVVGFGVQGVSVKHNKKSPISRAFDLVAKTGHLSNLIIIQDTAKVIDFLDNTHLYDCDFQINLSPMEIKAEGF